MDFKGSNKRIVKFDVQTEVKKMESTGDEISYIELVDQGSFKAGLVKFGKREVLDDNYVIHDRVDVLCYVISGHGQLRMDAEINEVLAGSIIHIPHGKRHDFVAEDELLVYYVQIMGEL